MMCSGHSCLESVSLTFALFGRMRAIFAGRVTAVDTPGFRHPVERTSLTVAVVGVGTTPMIVVWSLSASESHLAQVTLEGNPRTAVKNRAKDIFCFWFSSEV